MKNWFLLALVSFGAISCSTTRNVSKAPVAKATSSPEFINSISVTPGAPVKSSTVKKDIVYKTSPQTSLALDNRSVGIEKISGLMFKYAILLDIPVESISNQSDLFEFIDSWYGTPYRYGGTNRSGIDCSGFTGTLLSNVFGIAVPRTSKDQYHSSQKIAKYDLQEGDLVFFNIRGRGVSHVGVYLANNKFIHASVNNGVVISDLGDGYYSKKFIGGGRPSK